VRLLVRPKQRTAAEGNVPPVFELQLHIGRIGHERHWIFAYGAELRLEQPLDYNKVRELFAYILMLAQSQDVKA